MKERLEKLEKGHRILGVFLYHLCRQDALIPMMGYNWLKEAFELYKIRKAIRNVRRVRKLLENTINEMQCLANEQFVKEILNQPL